MNYTLDCEFNGWQGELLSLALYAEDNRSFYATLQHEHAVRYDPWVFEHVVPHLQLQPTVGAHQDIFCCHSNREQVQLALQNFLRGDRDPCIHVDWPDDIKYFSELLITGPGTMIDIPRVRFQLHRVDSYPTPIKDAIQHHAWYDALVLFYHLMQRQRISRAR